MAHKTWPKNTGKNVNYLVLHNILGGSAHLCHDGRAECFQNIVSITVLKTHGNAWVCRGDGNRKHAKNKFLNQVKQLTCECIS